MNGPALLSAYLKSKSLSRAEFAGLVGADRQRVWRWVRGDRGPGLDFALAIESVTDGAVPAASWADPDSPAHRAIVGRSSTVRNPSVRRSPGASTRHLPNRR